MGLISFFVGIEHDLKKIKVLHALGKFLEEWKIYFKILVAEYESTLKALEWKVPQTNEKDRLNIIVRLKSNIEMIEKVLADEEKQRFPYYDRKIEYKTKIKVTLEVFESIKNAFAGLKEYCQEVKEACESDKFPPELQDPPSMLKEFRVMANDDLSNIKTELNNYSAIASSDKKILNKILGLSLDLEEKLKQLKVAEQRIIQEAEEQAAKAA